MQTLDVNFLSPETGVFVTGTDTGIGKTHASAALLQAMQEHKVTVAGADRPLGRPFHVLATQNPIEQEGTYPLPEAQLDRFMLLHRLGYPGRDEEQDILQRQLGMGLRKEEGGAVPKTAFDMIDDSPVGTKADLVAAMEAVQGVHVSEVFLRHSVELVRRTRESKDLDFGCSPRAGLALVNAARARAIIRGRDYVTPEDLFDLAEDVVRPLMPRQQVIDRAGLILGYAGVYGSFLLHAQRAAERYNVSQAEILLELGRRQVVGGQEDMIIDVALELAAKHAAQEAQA